MNTLIDGTRVRDAILSECRPRVERLVERFGRPPGLAVILAGNNPASEVYVRNKIRACKELGIFSETLRPPSSVSTAELLEMVEALNLRGEIDGILVQLPLPAHVDSQAVLLSVSAAKDVDGFHPCNIGRLATGRPGPRACTPAGILELLKRYRIPIAGRNAVVVGRSDIVGKPVALLLLQENATVTVCHSKTRDLAAVCRGADILVAAIGRPAMITREFIKPGAVVIDVGTNRVDRREDAVRIFGEGSAKVAAFDEKGSLLAGDVHPEASAIADAWTPVPGGVGPLTIAMLMRNTIDAAEAKLAGV
jgi:methylenetetrahydrofolate dehydrogenase (NADP+) / methenyltetrahydrofolate cyclohydrolase